MPDSPPRTPPATEVAGTGTRERLIEAAARLFAERGQENVSIREIAAAAGVQHGCLNYHFRGKRDLYLEVLERYGPPGADIRGGGHPAFQAGLDATTPAAARAALEEMVRTLVVRCTHPPSSIAMGLMQHEMSKPGGPDDQIFENVIERENRAIGHALAQLTDGLEDPVERRLAALGVVAQCLVLRVARPIVQRLLDVQEFDGAWVERITQRIVRTTLHGLDEAAR